MTSLSLSRPFGTYVEHFLFARFDARSFLDESFLFYIPSVVGVFLFREVSAWTPSLGL